MTDTGIESILHRDNLTSHIVEKLGTSPVDFSETMASVIESNKTSSPVRAAGVLLLLKMIKKSASVARHDTEYSFLLIKRSPTVSQPGDLGCPGGLLNPFIDSLLRPFITGRISPILTGKSREFARSKNTDTYKTMTLLLTNALRETWEETGLCPYKVVFLGPLPTYSLHLFKRAIFPLTGLIKDTWSFRLNSEVERIVEIPLGAFFNRNNYGLFQIELSHSYASGNDHSRKFPCFIYQDSSGPEEILWGATYSIIMNFLDIVFNYKILERNSGRVITKILDSDYMKGH
jgi:8-oxo-dGTP pyrophosphatase MutT (NUDIX family)